MLLSGLKLPRANEVERGSTPPEGVDVMWRIEAVSYSYVIDADSELYGSSAPVLSLVWHRVARRTPCGARLQNGRFVYTDKRITQREWASATPEAALASFAARKKRQIAILQAQLRRAKLEAALAQDAML